MTIASTQDGPDVRCAGCLATFEHVQAATRIRLDDRGGAYCASRAICEGTALRRVGDLNLTVLPEDRLLSEAKQKLDIRFSLAGTSSGKAFSG